MQLAGNCGDRRAYSGQRLVVPARDVLHIRLHTNANNPLAGQSPLEAATLDVADDGAMSAQQLAFYQNQARPSAVLTTDMTLTPQQVDTAARGMERAERRPGAGRHADLDARDQAAFAEHERPGRGRSPR